MANNFVGPCGDTLYDSTYTFRMISVLRKQFDIGRTNTPIRFVERTDSQCSNIIQTYVSFEQYVLKPGEKQEEVFHCSAYLGMQRRGDSLY